MEVTLEEINEIQDIKLQHILKEALDNPNCKIVNKLNYKIYVKVPSIANIQLPYNREVYGLYISLYSNEIHVWVAVIDNGEIRDGYGIGSFSYNTSLDEIISESTVKANMCDFCKQNVGLENLVQIAFANKSCKDCAGKARAKLETPGWYD